MVDQEAIELQKAKQDFEKEIESLEAGEDRALGLILHDFATYAAALLQLKDEMLVPHSNPDGIEALKGRLTGVLGEINTRIGQLHGVVSGVLSQKGRALLSRIWSWFSGTLMAVLSRIAGPLKIQSWSFGVTGGFPAGLSTTITVTFGP